MCTHRQQSLLGVIYQGLSTRSLTCLELPKQAKLTGQQTQILLLLPPLLGSQLCDHGLLHELLQTDLRFPHSCGGAPLHRVTSPAPHYVCNYIVFQCWISLFPPPFWLCPLYSSYEPSCSTCPVSRVCIGIHFPFF